MTVKCPKPGSGRHEPENSPTNVNREVEKNEQPSTLKTVLYGTGMGVLAVVMLPSTIYNAVLDATESYWKFW